MHDTFSCGHFRSAGNTVNEYGYRRCRSCKNARSRRHMRRKRAEWAAQNGRCSAAA